MSIRYRSDAKVSDRCLIDINLGVFAICMMTSSNGNIFHVTGHLCGEFTGPRWIPHTKASDARGALIFPLIYARINGWVNNREAGDLRRHRAHYDIIVMWTYATWQPLTPHFMLKYTSSQVWKNPKELELYLPGFFLMKPYKGRWCSGQKDFLQILKEIESFSCFQPSYY